MVSNYEDFKKEVLKLSTIDLNAYKERQMKRRIDSLISKNGYSGYDSYLKEIKTNKKLYDEFVTYLTINVSEFYRNPTQWEVLEKEVIPYLIDKFSTNLKIWSAACSTGDEPYSLVMLLNKFLPLNKINIIATDIDKQILAKAAVGLYTEKSLVALPQEFKNKHFTKVGNSYKINDDIKKCIKFQQHNLLKDPYPSDAHLIVCRNVLIYFTEEAKNDIYHKFNQSLRKDGIIFVGSTEQIIQSQRFGFQPQKSFFYKKIE
jgi:chemotaxis protein methyltransferase CheR